MSQEMSVTTFSANVSANTDMLALTTLAIKENVIQTDLPETPHYFVKGFIADCSAPLKVRVSDVSVLSAIPSPISGKYLIDCNIYNDNMYVPIDQITVVSGNADVLMNVYYYPQSR